MDQISLALRGGLRPISLPGSTGSWFGKGGRFWKNSVTGGRLGRGRLDHERCRDQSGGEVRLSAGDERSEWVEGDGSR